MLRGTRPTVPLAASAVVLAAVLSACGTDTPGTGLDFGDRLDAVTVSGDIGAATIDFKERMQAGEIESETVIEGDGEALAADDTVFVNYLIGNGYTQSAAVDSFEGDAAAIELTVGAEENPDPQSLDDVIKNFLRGYVEPGVTKGTRLVMTGNTEAFFGQLALSPALAIEGIGNEDGLVMVVDVMDVQVLEGPEGETGISPKWAPKLEFGANGPTGFDFTGIEKPGDKATLLSAPLKTGTGAAVKEGDLLVLDYLGAVYGSDTPFDETYGADKEPIQLPLGSFVEGFNEALEGKTVGSRILMRIPPAKGYGDQAQGEDIPANSTLYFVVDILGAV